MYILLGGRLIHWVDDALLSSSEVANDDDSFEVNCEDQLQNVNLGSSTSLTLIAQWDDANPDAVMAWLKALKEEAIVHHGLKSFYKCWKNEKTKITKRSPNLKILE